jgi:hypothetical protein
MEATMTVAITRSDQSASELREAAAGTPDAKAARRMLAIALVLEGWSRKVAAEACAMDRQTLRDWVHRYNADGLEELFNQPRRNGPLPRLSTEQLAEMSEWVAQGPDLEQHGVTRWRCVRPACFADACGRTDMCRNEQAVFSASFLPL